jgi:hypothetical protein
MPQRDINITLHARERFIERFSDRNKEYAHLEDCKTKGGCARCVSLTFQLKRDVFQKREFYEKVISEKLNEAEETKIYLNNSNFMHTMYERYGHRRFRFLVNDECVFVVIDDEKGNTLVSCLESERGIFNNFSKRPKYKKRMESIDG